MNVVNEISSSETEGITVNPIIKDSAESLTKPTNEVIKTRKGVTYKSSDYSLFTFIGSLDPCTSRIVC